MKAPILLFAYDRPVHIMRTIEALQCNFFSDLSDLIVFSDCAASLNKQEKVDEVRSCLANIAGFRSVSIHHRLQNYGLAKSIIEGVTQVLSEYDRLIVLEDDMVTSPYFLTYMNEALERFAEDERIISVHGWRFPTDKVLPEAFFLHGADCWGWGTWARGWKLFNSNGQELLGEIDRRGLRKAFDVNGTYPYSKMLEDQIRGLNNSWAIRWYASAFLAGKLTLYPGRSLVHNIGNDSSGTHCGKSDSLDAELSSTAIDLQHVSVTPSIEGRAALEDFFRRTQGGLKSRVFRRIKQVVSR
ncbi:MAG: glycosyltransferase family 2 protein [Bacteroidales bacterium]